jgi:hypothetical protein
MNPGVTFLGARMGENSEHFDIALPHGSSKKHFVDVNTLDVLGRTSVKFGNDPLQGDNVIPIGRGVIRE